MPFKKSEICLTYQISTLWKNQVMSSCIKNRNQRIVKKAKKFIENESEFWRPSVVVRAPKVTIIFLRNPGIIPRVPNGGQTVPVAEE